MQKMWIYEWPTTLDDMILTITAKIARNIFLVKTD